MPHSVSAAKRVRQNVKRRARNRTYKTKVKTTIKKLNRLVAEGQHEEAAKNLKTIQRLVDRAVCRHVLPLNRASSLKARLSRLLAKAKPAAAAPPPAEGTQPPAQ